MSSSTEAPASFNFRMAYKGVEVQFTHRDMETKLAPYMEKAKTAIDWALQNEYGVIPPKSFGFPKKEAKPLVYASYPCPKCGNKVVKEEKFEKCETQKYDFKTKEKTGCQYFLWTAGGTA